MIIGLGGVDSREVAAGHVHAGDSREVAPEHVHAVDSREYSIKPKFESRIFDWT